MKNNIFCHLLAIVSFIRGIHVEQLPTSDAGDVFILNSAYLHVVQGDKTAPSVEKSDTNFLKDNIPYAENPTDNLAKTRQNSLLDDLPPIDTNDQFKQLRRVKRGLDKNKDKYMKERDLKSTVNEMIAMIDKQKTILKRIARDNYSGILKTMDVINLAPHTAVNTLEPNSTLPTGNIIQISTNNTILISNNNVAQGTSGQTSVNQSNKISTTNDPVTSSNEENTTVYEVKRSVAIDQTEDTNVSTEMEETQKKNNIQITNLSTTDATITATNALYSTITDKALKNDTNNKAMNTTNDKVTEDSIKDNDMNTVIDFNEPITEYNRSANQSNQIKEINKSNDIKSTITGSQSTVGEIRHTTKLESDILTTQSNVIKIINDVKNTTQAENTTGQIVKHTMSLELDKLTTTHSIVINKNNETQNTTQTKNATRMRIITSLDADDGPIPDHILRKMVDNWIGITNPTFSVPHKTNKVESTTTKVEHPLNKNSTTAAENTTADDEITSEITTSLDDNDTIPDHIIREEIDNWIRMQSRTIPTYSIEQYTVKLMPPKEKKKKPNVFTFFFTIIVLAYMITVIVQNRKGICKRRAPLARGDHVKITLLTYH